jgi:purine catabolism regulator
MSSAARDRAAGGTAARSTSLAGAERYDERTARALLRELRADPPADATYRLLIGVLLRDPQELELLVRQTLAPIVAYDDQHGTDLLSTLQTFLAHDGSTTETAEALNLHRHTVGYRLARAHDVSGLSPYESSGRERLSLGLKAHQLLEANGRLTRL